MTKNEITPGKIIASGMILLIQGYQKFFSPFLGRSCRFHPTCSHYAIEAIQKKGCFTGTRLAVTRLIKCHPFHPGGYDPIEA